MHVPYKKASIFIFSPLIMWWVQSIDFIIFLHISASQRRYLLFSISDQPAHGSWSIFTIRFKVIPSSTEEAQPQIFSIFGKNSTLPNQKVNGQTQYGPCPITTPEGSTTNIFLFVLAASSSSSLSAPSLSAAYLFLFVLSCPFFYASFLPSHRLSPLLSAPFKFFWAGAVRGSLTQTVKAASYSNSEWHHASGQRAARHFSSRTGAPLAIAPASVPTWSHNMAPLLRSDSDQAPPVADNTTDIRIGIWRCR